MSNIGELKQLNKCRECLEWLLRQQYYIIHPNIKEKIRKALKDDDEMAKDKRSC